MLKRRFAGPPPILTIPTATASLSSLPLAHSLPRNAFYSQSAFPFMLFLSDAPWRQQRIHQFKRSMPSPVHVLFYRLEEGDVWTFPLTNHNWVDSFSSVTSGHFSHGTQSCWRIRAVTQSAWPAQLFLFALGLVAYMVNSIAMLLCMLLFLINFYLKSKGKLNYVTGKEGRNL